MELKNVYVLFIGIVIMALLTGLSLKKTTGKKNQYKGGKKIADNLYIQDDPYFKKKTARYKTYNIIIKTACMLSIGICFFMLSRPVKKSMEESSKYSRDIVLCIDISTSVDQLNENLVDELKSTVKKLKGERFSIVIFNTTAVTLTPLTTDYEYVAEQLDMIKECLETRNNKNINSDDDDFYKELYMDQYISEGTLVGADERGSSLIGDGLAAAAYEFNEKDKDRTKLIIFTSDNDLQGNPIFTLDEAAALCKKNNIAVFGIGTREMDEEYMENMKSAVINTGGKFYLEEQSGTFEQIVKNIEKTSKSLIKEKTEIRETEMVQVPFIILLITVSLMIVFVKIAKR